MNRTTAFGLIVLALVIGYGVASLNPSEIEPVNGTEDPRTITLKIGATYYHDWSDYITYSGSVDGTYFVVTSYDYTGNYKQGGAGTIQYYVRKGYEFVSQGENFKVLSVTAEYIRLEVS